MAVIALLGTAAFAPVAWGADTAPFEGNWQLKITTDDGQTLTPELKLERKDGKLQATMLAVYGKDMPAEDVALEGDDLRFKVEVDLQGTPLIANFDLKHADGKLKGSVDYDLSGQIGTLAVTGTRAAATTEAKKLHQGSWILEFATDDGKTLKCSVKLSGEANELRGTFTDVDGNQSKIDAATVKEDELSFKVAIEFQGTPLAALFKLKATDTGAKGTVDYEMDGQTGTLDVIGKRPEEELPAGSTAGIAGTWNLEVTGDDGNKTSARVDLQVDDGQVSGVVTLHDGRKVKIEEASYKDGDLSFTINVDFDGAALMAKAKGKVDGRSVKGEVDFEINGHIGTLQFVGKKAEEQP